MTSGFRISIFGLDIPLKYPVSMFGTFVNLLSLERYKQLIKEIYLEPNGEVILGSFYKLHKHREQEKNLKRNY